MIQVEYIVVVFDTDSKTARLCLRASDILATLQAQESDERLYVSPRPPSRGSNTSLTMRCYLFVVIDVAAR